MKKAAGWSEQSELRQFVLLGFISFTPTYEFSVTRQSLVIITI